MRLVDAARGYYSHAPWWVRRLVGRSLAIVPLRARLGQSYFDTLGLVERGSRDPDFVREYRRDALREIISSCSASAHYSRVFAATPGGVDAATFGEEDLARLPILQKSDVRGHLEDFVTTDVRNLDMITTGGTSGIPTEFYLDNDRGPREWAFITHIWSKGGYRPGDRRAVLRGVWIRDAATRPWEFDPALNELRLSPFHMTPETLDLYLSLITRFSVRFIHGYPSAISILASRAIATGWDPPESLTGVLPISESMFDHQRCLCREAFPGVSILPFYGLSEKVAIAGESRTEEGVCEFEPLYGITELVDDDGVSIQTPGVRGRIVSTGLISRGMPLIRYDTDDMGTLVSPATHSNGYRLAVKGIVSRWNQSYLVGKHRELISMAAINIHSTASVSVQEVQFHQDVAGEVTIFIVARSDYRDEDIEDYVSEIQKKVGAAVVFRAEVVDEIATTSRGKRRLVDQRLRVGPE